MLRHPIAAASRTSRFPFAIRAAICSSAAHASAPFASALCIVRPVHSHFILLSIAQPVKVASARFFMSSASATSPAAAAAPTASQPTDGGPVQQRIYSKLTATFTPSFLQVQNESHMHSVPRGSETHFKVTVVSAAFDSLNLLARHRAINTALAEELQSGVHALSIHARTPAQWATDHSVTKSPACLGGSKLDARAPE